MPTLAAQIASAIQARDNCAKSDRVEWQARHESLLDYIARNVLPRGSGIDSGTTIDDASTVTRLILRTSFRHTDENGVYDGWTEHLVIVTPRFAGIDIRITGPNRNGVKEYLADVFHDCLSSDFTAPPQVMYAQDAAR